MQPVSWTRRIVALFIDWVVAMLTTSAITGDQLFGEDAVNPFLTLGVFFVEVTLLTGLLGYTIGKRITGLKVENPSGRPIGLPRAAVRTALLCLVVPAVVMNDERRGFHEVASASRIVAH